MNPNNQMKETWKNFDEYWESIIERKVHIASEIVMDPNARGNELELCKAVWEACAESYRCPQLEKRLEAAERVIEVAKEVIRDCHQIENDYKTGLLSEKPMLNFGSLERSISDYDTK